MALLTTETLAEQISISPRTLERWRLTGCGPPFMKAGRRVLYSSQNVEEWLAQTLKSSTSETVQ
jgi:DNA-binding transcriptional MerR regulator